VAAETHLEVTKPRLRRTSQEIRGLLLAAAAGYFARNGYAGTSTRAIATEAGVSETLLFRHFGTKSGLFEVTTLDRFRVVVDEFVARWDRRSSVAGEEEAHARAYLAAMLKLVRAQRGVMFALLTLDRDEPEVEAIQAAAIEAFEKLLVAVTTHVLTDGGGTLWPGVDPEVTAPAVAAVVLSVTLLDGWLFPPGSARPPTGVVDDEVATYVLYGVGARPH
jgi:AcrR family transcriptional regulator